MDWSEAKDDQIKERLLIIWDQENKDIQNRTGAWEKTDIDLLRGALMGVARVMRKILTEVGGA